MSDTRSEGMHAVKLIIGWCKHSAREFKSKILRVETSILVETSVHMHTHCYVYEAHLSGI